MKNFLFQALCMLMGTFVFAASDIEVDSSMQNKEAFQFLNVGVVNEMKSIDLVIGCTTTYYVVDSETNEVLHQFSVWNEACDSDSEMVIIPVKCKR